MGLTIKVADRAKETVSSSGLADFTLTGAVANYQPFSNVLTANGEATYYCAESAAQWEIGIGTRLSATSMQRTTILSSSTGGAKVDFAAPPTIFSTVPASLFPPAGFAAFDAASSAAQTFPINTLTKVLLAGTKSYDPDSCFDSPTSRFTAPVDGVYEFFPRIARSNPTVEISSMIQIHVNGAGVSTPQEWTGKWTVMAPAVAVKLNRNDYVELWFNPFATETTTTGARLIGKLVRKL